MKTNFCQKRYKRLYDFDLYKRDCKPVLKLDFTAHDITESLSEFALRYLLTHVAVMMPLQYFKNLPDVKEEMFAVPCRTWQLDVRPAPASAVQWSPRLRGCWPPDGP